MKQAGQVVLFRFPRTDLEEGKFRPALLLGRLPGEYDDWLLCMISSQVRHRVAGFDEVIRECAHAQRPDGKGTWIVDDMIHAYVQLHQAGFSHSVESWFDGKLMGGLYGVSLGRVFFGESN